MERYIGLDAHAASYTLAVISQAGRRLKDFPVETNGQALVEAIRMIPGHKHLVFEEGLQSAWLYETLRPHVDEVVVAGGHEEPWAEERSAGRLRPGREAPERLARQEDLQGTPAVHVASGALAGTHHGERPRAREASLRAARVLPGAEEGGRGRSSAGVEKGTRSSGSWRRPLASGRSARPGSCRLWSPRIASAPSDSSGATAGSGS
jgi:hypothetical protein